MTWTFVCRNVLISYLLEIVLSTVGALTKGKRRSAVNARVEVVGGSDQEEAVPATIVGKIQALSVANCSVADRLDVVLNHSCNCGLLCSRVAVLAVGLVSVRKTIAGSREGSTASAVRSIFDDATQPSADLIHVVSNDNAGCCGGNYLTNVDILAALESSGGRVASNRNVQVILNPFVWEDLQGFGRIQGGCRPRRQCQQSC
jgi:hypothetical protein